MKVLLAQDALAVGGEFGILEGRSFALVHPIVMGAFFFYTLWAGYLGWQWRRVRTIQNDINELKNQLKPTPVTPDGKQVEEASPSPSPSPVELQIQQLTEVPTETMHVSYIPLLWIEKMRCNEIDFSYCVLILKKFIQMNSMHCLLQDVMVCGSLINLWMLNHNGIQ